MQERREAETWFQKTVLCELHTVAPLHITKKASENSHMLQVVNPS